MEKPIPSLSLAHPKSAAERFLTEMLMMSKWDHLFRVEGINYPLMPKHFDFIPHETMLVEDKQLDGEDALVFFVANYSQKNSSTIAVGMRKEVCGNITTWHPNSLFIDLYLQSEQLRRVWGADRCTMPVRRITA